MTPLLPRLGRLALALIAAGMLSPGVGLAQIASPSNAGGNSGNNTSGSSNTPIGTPNLSLPNQIPNLPGVVVTSPSQITASPAQITAMQSAVIQTATSLSPAFLQIVNTADAPVQVVVGPAAQLPIIIVNDVGNFETTTSFQELPEVVSRSLDLGTPLIVKNTALGVTATITTTGLGGEVTVSLPSSPPLVVQTTPETTLAVIRFAAIAAAAGLTSQSIQMGIQILPLLLQVASSPTLAQVQAMQLLAALQGLSTQSNLANLNQAITTWNQLINTATEAQLLALVGNNTFIGIGDILRAAESGIANTTPGP